MSFPSALDYFAFVSGDKLWSFSLFYMVTESVFCLFWGSGIFQIFIYHIFFVLLQVPISSDFGVFETV
jgi:hypothetical protein